MDSLKRKLMDIDALPWRLHIDMELWEKSIKSGIFSAVCTQRREDHKRESADDDDNDDERF